MRVQHVLLLSFSVVALTVSQGCTREPDADAAGPAQPNPDAKDESWPSYNRTLDGQRYSPLAQVTTANVAALKPVCEMTMGEEGGFQTGPVVAGMATYRHGARE